MNGFASRGHRPRLFDLFMLLASFTFIAWLAAPH
jgi:hypothetical protein